MNRIETPSEKMSRFQSKWKPQVGTGKTQFNAHKKAGESWTKIRDDKWNSK